MKRKRLTQVFPFLLPIRKWQRKKLFYLEMLIDGNKYAKNKSEALLPNTVFETSSLMLNENSGFDMKYQINKVHNLKLAARTINKVIIEPNETFSFWQLVRWADHHEKYKDGLSLVDGKIVGTYGGGLCQLIVLDLHSDTIGRTQGDKKKFIQLLVDKDKDNELSEYIWNGINFFNEIYENEMNLSK